MRSFSSPSSEATSVARTMALRDGSPCGAAIAASTPWSRATSWRNPARRRNAAPPAYWAKPDAPNTMGSGGKDEHLDLGRLGQAYVVGRVSAHLLVSRGGEEDAPRPPLLAAPD